MLSSVTESRIQLLARLFPGGIPKLWCPAITHYDRDGRIDPVRIAAHLKNMSANVRGFLIPGSTGDGWELNDSETKELVKIGIECARELDLHLVVGALKPNAAHVLRFIWDTMHQLGWSATQRDVNPPLANAHVRGFVVCPPHGKDMTQFNMEKALEAVLDSQIPIALYQLPQVTQNEMVSELVSDLAARFPNFFMFKDTSSTDRVISSGRDLGGVFMVRGAERNYAKWLKAAGGRYDGFLLSTANCFASELRQMITDLEEGRIDAGNKKSEQLTGVISDVFNLVSAFPHGNAFANANKAMDHFFAFGPKAATVPAPRLHGGMSLPTEMIVQTGKLLQSYGLMPAKGYLV
jgi:dihydrodipicolinate synthase/N-acetylneuraminate lyase